MKCNYKESRKLAFKNFILVIKIGLPIFLISLLILEIYFDIQKDIFGISFIFSLWSFFNIIHFFNIEFYSSGIDINTGCFEYKKYGVRKEKLGEKIFFLIITTLVAGYLIYNIWIDMILGKVGDMS